MVEKSAAEEAHVENDTQNSDSGKSVKLNGLFAFKVGMISVYDANGEMIPATILKFENQFVSQIKTEESDGYEAVQVALRPSKKKNSSAALQGHLKKTPLNTGAQLVKEIRQKAPEGLTVGAPISIQSLSKGDVVCLTAKSKGRGFAGAIKRFNYSGGPGSHGSHFHRQPGSSGNRTWPGRVMPGKRWPGQFGNETVTIKNVHIVDVIPEEGVLLVKGSVPGGTNTLVSLNKMEGVK